MTMVKNETGGSRAVLTMVGEVVFANGETKDVSFAPGGLTAARMIGVDVDGEDGGGASVGEDAASLKVRIADLELKLTDALKQIDELTAPSGPNYERDNLAIVDLHKPTTSKDMLLVIAAYEKADVPGDDPTKADLAKAIEAKRKG